MFDIQIKLDIALIHSCPLFYEEAYKCTDKKWDNRIFLDKIILLEDRK